MVEGPYYIRGYDRRYMDKHKRKKNIFIYIYTYTHRHKGQFGEAIHFSRLSVIDYHCLFFF